MMVLSIVVTFIGFNTLFIGTTGFALGEWKSLDIDGKQISIDHAPYTVAVFLGNKFMCAASIIHEQFALSAAQCFETNDQGWKVLIGSHDLNTGGVFIEVEIVLCHQLYNIYFEHDICLLKLKNPLPLGCFWNVDKIALPRDNRQLLEGTMVNVTGWEYNVVNRNRQMVGNNLRQITIPIVSNKCCKLVHPGLTSLQICAGSNARDTCTGGSGGPMVYNGVQIGVISYSWSECAKYPAVYTKVAEYVPWITETIYNATHL